MGWLHFAVAGGRGNIAAFATNTNEHPQVIPICRLISETSAIIMTLQMSYPAAALVLQLRGGPRISSRTASMRLQLRARSLSSLVRRTGKINSGQPIF